MKRFEIKLMDEAVGFLEAIDIKAREKVLYNMHKVQLLNDNQLFKKLNNDIWEFRTLYGKQYYRLFAFWDKRDRKRTLIIATHGLIKKNKKVTTRDMKKAIVIMKRYFEH